MNIDVPYGITKRLNRTTLADARGRVIESLRAEGFGVLTEIDVESTLRTKIGVELGGGYVILGTCNPSLAHRALVAEPGIGLLLPCNVVVAQDGQDAVVSMASPRAMFGIVSASTPALASIANEAEERLRRALTKT